MKMGNEMKKKKDEHLSTTFLKWLISSTKAGSIKIRNELGKDVYFSSEFISDAVELPLRGEVSFSPITATRGDHDPLDVLTLWTHVDSDNAGRVSEFPLNTSCVANSGDGIDLYWKLKKDLAGELPSIEEAEPYLKKLAEWFGGEGNVDQLIALPEKFNLSEEEYLLEDFDFLLNQEGSSGEEETSQTEEIESQGYQDTEESFTEPQSPSPEIVEKKLPEEILIEQPALEIDTSLSERVDSELEGHFTEEGANKDISDLGGWIKLHRKILDNPVFKNSFTYHLFSYLLLRANHKLQRFLFNGREIVIGRGQFITGIEQMSHKTRITRSRVRERLRALENLNMITRKTTNRFSIITICNYDQYQSTNYEKSQAELQKSDGQTAIKPQSNRNQTAANKNVRKKNNVGRSKKETDPRVKEFFNYWGKTFRKETGQPYVFSFGKDGDLVKALLQVHPLETLQEKAGDFFRDDEARRRGFDIGTFKLMINRIVSRKSMDPIEQVKRGLAERGKK